MTITLELIPSSISTNKPVTAKVTRDGVLTAGKLITFASSNTAVAKAPANLWIPANQASGSVLIQPVGAGSANITASSAGETDDIEALTVVDSFELSVSLDTDVLAKSGSATLTVSRTGSTASSINVNVESSNTDVATLASSTVTLGVGVSSNTVAVNASALNNGVAELKASHANAISDAAIAVCVATGSPSLTVTLVPDSAIEGDTVTAKIVRSTTAGDITVQLSSTDETVGIVDNEVVILDGDSEVEVDVSLLSEGYTSIVANYADYYVASTIVVGLSVHVRSSPKVDESGFFTIHQNDDYEVDSEVGGIGPIRIKTDIPIASADRLRFGASVSQSGFSEGASTGNIIGAVYFIPVFGKTNVYDLYIAIPRAETNNTVGSYSWDIEAVFSDNDVRTVMSGTMNLERSWGDNEDRDPLNS